MQPLEPLGRDDRVDELGLHGGGFGALARREDERVGVVVLGLGSHGQRLFEISLGLAGEADDDVGRHGQVIDGAAGFGQACEIPLGGVSAVHQREHPVAPGLQGVVQVLADGCGFRHCGERVGAHVLRVWARVTDPSDTVDGTDVAK